MSKIDKIYRIISYAFALFITISFGFTTFKMVRLDVLPTKYTVVFIAILLALVLLTIILMFRKNKALRIIGYVFTILFGSLMLYGTTYVNIYEDFVGKITKTDATSFENYYLYVRKSDSDKISDYQKKTIGILEADEANSREFLNTINLKDSTIQTTFIQGLYTNLSNKTFDGIVLTDSTIELLKELNFDIDGNFKKVSEDKVSVENTAETKSVNVKNRGFIVYISGIDTAGNINAISRSDVNILAVVNPTTRKILLIHIPRDSYMKLANINTTFKDKLTHTGMYGINNSVKTIENYFGIDINYYVRLNFSSMVDAVDALNGITLYNKYSFQTYGYDFPKGNISLNGKEALAYSRERKNLANGDISRGEHQMATLTAMIKKASNISQFTRAEELLNTLDDSFQTNMSQNDINSLIKMQLNNPKSWSVDSYQLTGVGKMVKTYSFQTQDLFVFELNQSQVSTAKSKIKDYLK